MSKLNTDEFRHVKLLLFWPLFGIMFSFVERFYNVGSYYVMHCAFDDAIPFCEWFLIPYLFWFVYLIGTLVYTFFFDVPAFKRMMRFIICTYTITMVIYLLFPTCQNLPVDTRSRLGRGDVRPARLPEAAKAVGEICRVRNSAAHLRIHGVHEAALDPRRARSRAAVPPRPLSVLSARRRAEHCRRALKKSAPRSGFFCRYLSVMPRNAAHLPSARRAPRTKPVSVRFLNILSSSPSMQAVM